MCDRHQNTHHAWKTYFKECILVSGGLPPLYPAVSSGSSGFRVPLAFSFAPFLRVAARCEFSFPFQRDGRRDEEVTRRLVGKARSTLPDTVTQKRHRSSSRRVIQPDDTVISVTGCMYTNTGLSDFIVIIHIYPLLNETKYIYFTTIFRYLYFALVYTFSANF